MPKLNIFKENASPVVLDIRDGSYTIGSNYRCRIILNDDSVAERHALLIINRGVFKITDISNSTGIRVNGVMINKNHEVPLNTPIEMGRYTITITEDAPVETPAENTPAEESWQSVDPATEKASTENNTIISKRTLEDTQSLAAPSSTNESEDFEEVVNPEFDEDYENIKKSVKAQIHKELIERLDIKRLSTMRINVDELKDRAKQTIEAIIFEVSDKLPQGINAEEIEREILNEAIGLGPLEELLSDDSITEIMVNGPNKIFVEKKGKLTLSGKTFMDEQSIMAIIERIVAPLGRRVDESQPYVDARLADGSRVNCVIHPLSLIGPCITIRKFSKKQLFVEDLIKYSTLTPNMASFLQACILMRKNIIVSGGTGSGKTTLLNVLSNFLPEDERILTIEDAAELRLNQPHLVRLEARPPNIEGKGAITIRDLVRNALRMRPDRIIVGECRGGEALDMLQAMNTGHDGSLTTVHANAPRDVIARLETMVLMSGMELPSRAIREQIASAVDIIVHESRLSDGSRKVTCISEVVGLEGNQITMQDIFEFKQEGIDSKGKIIGRFRPTGSVPTFFQDLATRGIHLDPVIFQPEK